MSHAPDGRSRRAAPRGYGSHGAPRGRDPRAWAASALVVAVVFAALGLGGYLLLGGDGDGVQESGSASSTPAPPPTEGTGSLGAAPSERATSTPSPDVPDPTPSATRAWRPGLMIYYVGDPAGSPVLYPETHGVPRERDLDHLGRTALEIMLGEPPMDPDYRSLWPAGTRIRSFRVDGDVASVDLTAFPSLDPAAEHAAVQQVVYTVTTQERVADAVLLTVDGKPPTPALARPVPRDRPADVISKVFLAIPEEGQTVTSPVRVMVAGEGVVQVMVVSAGTEVAETTIPSYQSGFHERSAEFALEPGTYELRVLAPSGEHGSEAQLWDTKTFTVE